MLSNRDRGAPRVSTRGRHLGTRWSVDLGRRVSDGRRDRSVRLPPAQRLEVLAAIYPDSADPGGDGIAGPFPATQGRRPNAKRLRHLGCRQVPGLPQLKHPPVATAVLVPVDVPGSPAPIVGGGQTQKPPPAPPATLRPPRFPDTLGGGKGPTLQ